MERFLNHLLYGFYLIDKRIFFFNSNSISWSTGKMYNIIINGIAGSTGLLLSIIGLSYIRSLDIPYIFAVFIILILYSGLPYYEYHVERKYKEYFKEFQNDTFARKLSWVLISYITLLLSWGYLVLGAMIFLVS